MWELLLGEGAKRRGAAGGPQTLRVPGRAEMGAGGTGKEGREGRRKGSSGAGRRGQARRSGPARPHKPSAGVGEGDPLRDPFPAAPRAGGEAAAGEGREAKGRPPGHGRPQAAELF